MPALAGTWPGRLLTIGGAHAAPRDARKRAGGAAGYSPNVTWRELASDNRR
jgi:hypothetical protein